MSYPDCFACLPGQDCEHCITIAASKNRPKRPKIAPEAIKKAKKAPSHGIIRKAEIGGDGYMPDVPEFPQ